jgi:aminomethyltransferase
MPWNKALPVFDTLMEAGRAWDIHAAGMLALDVARIEAGLLLIDVDFHSAKKAVIDSHKYSPFEMGLGRLVSLDKGAYVGRAALAAEKEHGHTRQVVGLEVEWTGIERIYERANLPAVMPAAASRVAVPVYANGTQVGKATSTTWSPVLKKLIALATVQTEYAALGTRLEVEVTVDAARHSVPASVVKTPFFDPKRKTAVPAL